MTGKGGRSLRQRMRGGLGVARDGSRGKIPIKEDNSVFKNWARVLGSYYFFYSRCCPAVLRRPEGKRVLWRREALCGAESHHVMGREPAGGGAGRTARLRRCGFRYRLWLAFAGCLLSNWCNAAVFILGDARGNYWWDQEFPSAYDARRRDERS